jgi:hypothetical protein
MHESDDYSWTVQLLFFLFSFSFFLDLRFLVLDFKGFHEILIHYIDKGKLIRNQWITFHVNI